MGVIDDIKQYPCAAIGVALASSAIVLLVLFLTGFIPFDIVMIIDQNRHQHQESLVVEASNSPITNVERDRCDSDWGLALTANNQVWLLNRDYVCQLNVPASIGIYIDKQNGYFILTKEMMIIGHNNAGLRYPFLYAIRFFSSRYTSSIQSLQLIGIFDQCEVTKVGEAMMLGVFDQEFNTRVLEI